MAVNKTITFNNCTTSLNGPFGALSITAGSVTKDVTFTAARVLPTYENTYYIEYDVTCDDMALKGFYALTVNATSSDEAEQTADAQITADF